MGKDSAPLITPNPLLLDDEDEPEEVEDDGSDPASDLAAEFNDPNVIDLSDAEPGAIGGRGGGGGFGGLGGFGTGGAGDDSVGRPTSPPLWRSAHLHANVEQLRVYKVIEGRDVHVGDIDAQASHNDFLRRFLHVMPKSGEEPARFKLHPLNRLGHEIGQEVVLPPIHPEHTGLRSIRAGADIGPVRGGAAMAFGGGGSGLNETLSVVDRMMAPMLRRLEASEAEARAARELAVKSIERTAEERIELAGRAGITVEALAEKSMANEAARNKQALEAQQAMSTSMLAMLQQSTERQLAFEAERRREEADRRDRERREYEDKIRREREEAEDRRRRERDEAEERRRRDQMEWERKMEAERLEREERMRRDEQRWERERLEETRRTEERERDRGRQHEQRLKEMEEQARRDREHQERMVQLTLQRSHNESPEGFIEKGAKLLAMFGMKPNDLVDRLTSTDAGPEAYAPIIEGVTSVLTTGMQALSDYAKTKATTDAARAAATQQAMVAAVAGPTVATAAIAGPAAPGTPAAPGAPAAPAAPAALRSNLPAHIQKAARDALIAVVRDLQRSTPDTWAKLFTDAITNTVAAYHYAKEVGLKPALREAGADDALTGAVGTQLQAQVAAFPLLADIPFGN
jgi:hypothetical protein